MATSERRRSVVLSIMMMNVLNTATLGWVEIGLLAAATVLLICGVLSSLRSYRALFWGGSALMLITAAFPRQGNPLGQYLFVGAAGATRVPIELFGIAWWILGAWLVKSLLDLLLRRTIFPDDNEPHARRLFADLASGLIYVLAFVGIMDTVLKQPISAVLATSGVLAIVLGLALQNTLADVFSGLAMNIERPFVAGDWITVTGGAEGEVIEINWRATRIRTATNDITVIPNSIVAKAVVTNHRRLNEPHIFTIGVKVDHKVPPARVLDALHAAASSSPGIASGTAPTAYACGFDDSLLTYELALPIDDFTLIGRVQSDVVAHVADTFGCMGIEIGTPAMAVRIMQPGDAAAERTP
jgi:small-conductance mechanosensitive channel